MAYYKYIRRTINGKRVRVKALVRDGRIVAIRKIGVRNSTDANTKNKRKRKHWNNTDSAMRTNY